MLPLKTPYRDGTTHLVMSPLEFLQRLAALVPRPRLHLIRFHGVLAPKAALRSQIVPGEADQVPNIANGDGELSSASTRTRLSWAQLLTRVFAIDLTTCPQCGGPLTLLAAIEDPAVIIKFLSHLGLPTRVPPKTPARLRRVPTDGLIVPLGAGSVLEPTPPFTHFPTPPPTMERKTGHAP